ncbi:MAG: phage holin family protein [Phaeodactylibacter xiamenensis]|jgi:putative membrane protein|uniref:Membrane protein n=1 Tax=Phaeodactylibacter xiamenensis TaxID=1524460 RepID=A0A098S394_9BACT|nr:phage holin family protein [Phaeodactylibacter xiamenensis]KGE86516.1 membrane protein [Phaeodactylibacter xiamenensis]MCR9050879.1 phage holin family protein [bacterium]
MRLLISLLVNGLLVYLCAEILSGVGIDGYFDAVIVALLLGMVNFFVKPVLTLLTLPITILTLGLFLLVINGAMVLLVDWMLDGFYVDGWIWAIVFALVMSFFNLFVGQFSVKEERK